jgi:ureidoacrylate peracid hydrolase
MVINLPANPESLKIDTDRTALIVVDMQNAFARKGGMLDLVARFDEEKANRTIAADKKVLDAFRRKGMKVVFLRMTYKEDLSDAGGPDSPHYYKQSGRIAMRENPDVKFLIEGTWDWDIIDELKPQPGETIVNKPRYSGFVKTDLDDILKAADIKYLVFIGIATNVCVESTLRDAFFRDYFPILVGDGCANVGPDFIQEATVFNVSTMFGWVTSTDELVKSLG